MPQRAVASDVSPLTLNSELSTLNSSLSLQYSGLKFFHFRIQRRCLQRPNQCLACLRRIYDRIDPKARSSIAGVGLMLIGGTDGFMQRFFIGIGELFSLAFELFDLDFNERGRGGIAAHHGVARRGPRENESRVVSLAAHGIVAGAETSAANHRDF